MKFYLKYKDGTICFSFNIDEADKHSMSGQCWRANTWGKNKEPIDWEFVTDVYLKWDTCTHWWFKGELWNSDDDDVDCYYHLCGANIFVDHIRAICFVWKVYCDFMEQFKDRIASFEKWYYGDEKIKPLIELMLNGYTIERVEE